MLSAVINHRASELWQMATRRHLRKNDVFVVDVLQGVGASEDLVELVVVDVDDDKRMVMRHLGEPLQDAAQVLDGPLFR